MHRSVVAILSFAMLSFAMLLAACRKEPTAEQAADEAARRGAARNAKLDEARACRRACDGLEMQLQNARDDARQLPDRRADLARQEAMAAKAKSAQEKEQFEQALQPARASVARFEESARKVPVLEQDLQKKTQECAALEAVIPDG